MMNVVTAETRNVVDAAAMSSSVPKAPPVPSPPPLVGGRAQTLPTATATRGGPPPREAAKMGTVVMTMSAIMVAAVTMPMMVVRCVAVVTDAP